MRQTEGMVGRRERRAVKKNPSVVIHFKDAAFDDAHVSVPHNLVSEGQKTERYKEGKL